ncbi:hypothetical protein SAMN04515667_2234 [Formosa sp. Hel1_31_208]|uniref:hypothetical protein n=1 Tax=Formosa sp. Hel1_31_208 TaxID=1798225 RepID=UPI00087B44D5|nr:hypothetical protein [Formosa sp. Hel1_31_208]SDS46283.1 hypothetical protein SAMN04515667_2234 [Formosa sp. Hel1_31_208]
MKTFNLTVLLCFTLMSTAFSQSREEKAKLKYEAQMEEKKEEYISDFLATLNIDDFQKEIIAQTMESYFEEFKKINMLGLRELERQELINKLDDSHFKDVKTMVSEDDMSSIMDAVKGKWKKNSKKKKKKRKEKNKN